MADRTMKQGDTYPPLKLLLSDEDGVIAAADLTAATSIEVSLKNGTTLVTNTPTVIDPIETDGLGRQWNLSMDFQAGDTDTLGTYTVEAKVTWDTGEIETFPNDGAPTLLIEVAND